MARLVTVVLVGRQEVALRELGEQALSLFELPLVERPHVKGGEARSAATRNVSITAVSRFADDVCMSSKEWPLVARVLAEAGAHWSDTIICVPRYRFTLGRADYQLPVRAGLVRLAGRQPAALGRRARVRAMSGPSRVPPPRRLHPTQKPLELVVAGESRTPAPPACHGSLDPFCGAGTTLIACERTGRRAVGVEIDPRYVAATIARWEAFTGAAAVAAGSGGGRRWHSRPACQALTQNGRPCRAPSLRVGQRLLLARARVPRGRRRGAPASAACAAGARGRSAYALEGFRTDADLQRVLELALTDTLRKLKRTRIARARALAHLVSVGVRVKETAEFEARLRALEVGVGREAPDAGP